MDKAKLKAAKERELKYRQMAMEIAEDNEIALEKQPQSYKPKQELTVITESKRLFSYLYVSTAKAPKLYRFSLIADLIESAKDAVRNMYFANKQDDNEKRYSYQIQADISLEFFSYLVATAGEIEVFSTRQLAVFAKHIFNTRKKLYAWLNTNPYFIELSRRRREALR